MNRKAFLLGLYSVGGQVLLLKELVSSLNGTELFIGTALFGWMISVAGGAYVGGRKFTLKPITLFIAGSVLLPASIIAARLCPLMATNTVGEIVPFTVAALMSITIMIPVGVISGWLFTAITREGHRPAASIVGVYLFEGIGAFVGGIIVMALAGPVFSNLGMALAIISIVIILYNIPSHTKGITILAGANLLILILIWFAAPSVDIYFDQQKYKSFKVEKSFDTHYGHQLILSHENDIILLTDNTIEATYPDWLTAENLLIPPLLYKPESKKVLLIGRAEFGVKQLAEFISGLEVTSVDPRKELTDAIRAFIPDSDDDFIMHDDAMNFLSNRLKSVFFQYDIIILNLGSANNYKKSRFITNQFLNNIYRHLNPGGIFFLSTEYDTDRYISPEKKIPLAMIYNSIKTVFRNVKYWPGQTTLFLASDSVLFNIANDRLIERLCFQEYIPQYFNDAYVLDRLNDFKIARLQETFENLEMVNSVEKPAIVHYQSILDSKLNKWDQRIIPQLLNIKLWAAILGVLIMALFITLIRGGHRYRNFGLFLYFTAGIVSLSLELMAFYLYQSSAGSLYSEMAILIGVFMLGLALGAYYSCRLDRENLEFPALLLLLTSSVIFYVTYDKFAVSMSLYYYILFLFTTAMATGSLFVGATDRYYFGKADANRGVGYAFEILGSAIGALTTSAVLLPTIGLHGLIISIVVLVVLTLAGAVYTAR